MKNCNDHVLFSLPESLEWNTAIVVDLGGHGSGFEEFLQAFVVFHINL